MSEELTGGPEEPIVKEVMNSPVITARAEEPISKIAELMRDYGIGSVVIMDELDRPVGIVTKTDIIKRVVAENLHPGEVKASDIMSSPLRTVGPDLPITEASRILTKEGIGRLCVSYRGKIVGIITLRDIIRIAPDLISLLEEKRRLREFARMRSPRKERAIGICDVCGRWSDDLLEIDGKFYCDECRADLQSESTE